MTEEQMSPADRVQLTPTTPDDDLPSDPAEPAEDEHQARIGDEPVPLDEPPD